MNATPFSRASRALAKVTVSPAIFSSPRSAGMIPPRIFMSVLLPAPFSPTSTCTSPGKTSKSTPSRILTSVLRRGRPSLLYMNLVTPRMEASGSMIVSLRAAVGQVAEDDRDQDDHALHGKIQVVGNPHQVDAVFDDLDAQHAEDAVHHRPHAAEQAGAAHNGRGYHFEGEWAAAHIG